MSLIHHLISVQAGLCSTVVRAVLLLIQVDSPVDHHSSFLTTRFGTRAIDFLLLQSVLISHPPGTPKFNLLASNVCLHVISALIYNEYGQCLLLNLKFYRLCLSFLIKVRYCVLEWADKYRTQKVYKKN